MIRGKGRGGVLRWVLARVRPRGRAEPVTLALIAVCCAVFVLSPASGLDQGFGSTGGHAGPGDPTGTARLLAAQRAYFGHWGVVPARLLSGSPRAALTSVTALFVHGSWLHLLGNMLFLYVFGGLAEQRMGHLRFALFYGVCGALALAGYALAHAGSRETLVGASGAISAVLGAFLFLLPRARVTSLFPFLFFLPLRFPAWVVLPFWAALQWLAARGTAQGPGVAYLAHVIGFALGFCYAWARYGRGWRRPRGDGGPGAGEPAWSGG